MPLTPSQRPTREWPRLIIAVFIVGIVVYPFYNHFNREAPIELKGETKRTTLAQRLEKGTTYNISIKSDTAQPHLQVVDKSSVQQAKSDGPNEASLTFTPRETLDYDLVVEFDQKQAKGAHGYTINIEKSSALWQSWSPERVAKLLLGPEQIACYACFVWGVLIFVGRYRETRRQRWAFQLGLLPTDEGARILQEDARPLQRRMDQLLSRHGPYILANMIRAGLAKLALSRSSEDVRETLKTQAEVDLGRLISSMATLNYLAWAIPAVGFFGTVRGLAGSMTLAGQGGEQLRIATSFLQVAFDCTLVALGLSLIAMFLIHTLQRDEESLVIDCQQYCLEHLVNRMYEPELAGQFSHGTEMNGGMMSSSLVERAP